MTSEVKSPAITIPHDHGHAVWFGVTVIFVAVALAVAFIQPKPQWASHAPSLALYLGVVAAVSAGMLYRSWRTGLRFDDYGLTICHFFWTDRFRWHEVSHFRDGQCVAGLGADRGLVWALEVVRRDGQVVVVKATTRDESAAPKVLAAVSQAAERYGIQAPLTGIMSTRRSRDSVEEKLPEPEPSPEPSSAIPPSESGNATSP